MTGFFDRLGDRATGTEAHWQPRPRSRFEPSPTSGGPQGGEGLLVAAGRTTADDDDGRRSGRTSPAAGGPGSATRAVPGPGTAGAGTAGAGTAGAGTAGAGTAGAVHGEETGRVTGAGAGSAAGGVRGSASVAGATRGPRGTPRGRPPRPRTTSRPGTGRGEGADDARPGRGTSPDDGPADLGGHPASSSRTTRDPVSRVSRPSPEGPLRAAMGGDARHAAPRGAAAPDDAAPDDAAPDAAADDAGPDDAGPDNEVRSAAGHRSEPRDASAWGAVEVTSRATSSGRDEPTPLALPSLPGSSASHPPDTVVDTRTLLEEHVVPALRAQGLLGTADRADLRLDGDATPDAHRTAVVADPHARTLAATAAGQDAAAGVHVHIGTVQVVRPAPPPPPAPPAAPAPDPSSDRLTAFLAERRSR